MSLSQAEEATNYACLDLNLNVQRAEYLWM
jgi:hypothetical protein